MRLRVSALICETTGLPVPAHPKDTSHGALGLTLDGAPGEWKNAPDESGVTDVHDFLEVT
jgi:hypothetical protein